MILMFGANNLMLGTFDLMLGPDGGDGGAVDPRVIMAVSPGAMLCR